MRVRNVFLILALVAGLAMVVTTPALAWNCAKYNFQVLADGTVQVENKSNSNEPAQTASVYVNGSLVTTLSVPAMPAHMDWTTIGAITPPLGSWTWLVIGSSDCSDSGSFEEPWDRSSVEVSGVCLQDGSARFTITNTGEPDEGDMDGPSDWRLFLDDVLTESGTFQLGGGESQDFTFFYPGQEVRFEADQRPSHPGSSHPQETLNCSAPPEEPATCTTVNASINDATMEVTGTGSGSNAVAWRVVRTSDNAVMNNGSGNSASFSFTGEYNTGYQLQFMGQDEVWSSEGCIFSFESNPTEEKPSCPTCGAPVWESSNGGMAYVWYSDTPCRVCRVDGVWQIELDSKVRVFSEIAFSLEYPDGVFHEPEVVAGSDGVSYWVLDVDDEIANNAIIWGPDGEGDRYREHGKVYKYAACSVAPGFYDAPGGTAIWKPGHNTSDWATFLLTNSFFPDEKFRGDAAIAWAEKLREEGELTLPPR